MSIYYSKSEDKIITKSFLTVANSFGEENINLRNEYLKKVCPLINKVLGKNGINYECLSSNIGVEKYYKFREKLVELFVSHQFGILSKNGEPMIKLDYTAEQLSSLINSMNKEEEELAKHVAEAIAIGTISLDFYDEEDFELERPSNRRRNG